MATREGLLSEIKLLSDSIRNKNQALKAGLTERTRYLEETFKPIIDPLNQLNETVRKTPVLRHTEPVKNERVTSETESSSKDMDTLSRSSEIIEEDDEDEDNLFEEGHVPSEGQTSESPSNISILSQEIGNKGPLSRKYILQMLHSTRKSAKYHVYGARLENDGLRIGDSAVAVDEKDNIIIKGEIFKGTPGLFELIFKTTPKKYSKNDLNTFKRICMITNSHRKAYSPSTPIHRNRSEKYKTVISRLFTKCRGKSAKGKGITMKNLYDTNIIYYNDVNKLVNRMKLLYESMQAGHNGLDSEMVALTEELKSRGFIV